MELSVGDDMETTAESSPYGRRRRQWRRLLMGLGILFLFGFVAVNIIAYMQARAMTHYVEGGQRTLAPEKLSFAQKVEVLFTGVRTPRPTDVGSPRDIGLDFQAVRFGYSRGDECEGWYIPCDGAGRVCIEFHAYVSSKSSLLKSARAFHDMGCDVLLVDFRGSGGSVGNRTTLGYDEAEDVAAAVEFVKRRDAGKPVVLYGQSMGGCAILRAVADLEVRPSAVIIESTFDRLLSTAENRFHAMGLPAFPLADLLVYWGGWQLGYSGFKLNPANYAMRVRCPVLMMQGGLDQRVTNSQARNLFDHLAGPREFELFDDCSHCDFLERDGRRWKTNVMGVLNGSVH